jgi:parvulin-like peptidyl-prolyl isomerase
VIPIVSTRTRGIAALAFAALLLGALTACSESDDLAGASATVGDARLSVQEVQDRSAEVQEVAGTVGAPEPDGAALNRAQVGTWVRGELSALAAADAGIVVTDGEVDRFLEGVVEANGTTVEQLRQALALQQDFWVPPSLLEDYARSFLEQQALARKLAPEGSEQEQSDAVIGALSAVAEEVGVTVAPRYGTWDPANARVELPADDLSSPAPASPGSGQPDGLVPIPGN